MKSVELWVVNYLLNSLWMVPLVFSFAWLSVGAMKEAGPKMEHRVWVSVLLLDVVLPACRFHVVGVWAAVHQILNGSGTTSGGTAHLGMITSASPGYGAFSLPTGMTAALVVAYGCGLLYFAVRLGWGLWTTRSMQREAQELWLEDATEQRWERCCGAFGFDRNEVRVASSPRIDGPVMVGIRRGLLLLPPGFLNRVEKSDLCAVMAHECAHMRRNDFLKNILYNVIALPVSYHPLLRRTLSRVAETREMICDAMAAEAIAGRESYARSLLRLASLMVERTPARTLHAIGIFDANSFERRVMSLTKNPIAVGRARRLAMVAVCVMVGAVTCGSALALRMEVGTRDAASADSVNATKNHVTTMPVLISSKQPEYPKLPKADRINGKCLLALTVDQDGVPQDVHVVKSLRPEYDQKAVEAVEQYRFRPALQDGQPIEKQLHIEVDFRVF
jgi:TonB family protein